jgi:hypothetical protein
MLGLGLGLGSGTTLMGLEFRLTFKDTFRLLSGLQRLVKFCNRVDCLTHLVLGVDLGVDLVIYLRVSDRQSKGGGGFAGR